MRGWPARALLLAIFFATLAAEARPGGGHSSSGGGRSSSSSSSRSSYSGGGGGGHGAGCADGDAVTLVFFLFVLTGIIFVGAKTHDSSVTWSSSTASAETRAQAMMTGSLAEPSRTPEPAALLVTDPGFSLCVFEDLVFELYSTAHRMRGDPSALSPYLSQSAAAQLAARGPAPHQVVIGTLRVESIAPGSQSPEYGTTAELITVRIEATLFVGDAPVFAVEQWQFARAPGTQSKPPVRTRTWPCPNCGAPWTAGTVRVCTHCGQDVDNGRFDWTLAQVWVASETPALASLTGTVDEYGNDLPTVIDRAMETRLWALRRDDPEVTREALFARVGMIYQRVNEAWNANDMARARGYITRALCSYLEYWLREYARQGLRNLLEEARLTRIDIAKVVRDAHYDAITVRVFAGGLDQTLDRRGKLVGGSRSWRRDYTEYWTFLRSSARRGPVLATPTCANCGAPLVVSDVGDCTHCNATIENGSFDWVLSKIEQDDWYAG